MDADKEVAQGGADISRVAGVKEVIHISRVGIDLFGYEFFGCFIGLRFLDCSLDLSLFFLVSFKSLRRVALCPFSRIAAEMLAM